MLDLDACIEKLYKCEPISEHAVKWICEKVRELLVNEPNVLCLSSPLTVVGDVHGQFYDVIELFRIAGYVPDTNYLFLGDFVDRGHHSVETVSLLLALKLRHPHRVHLLRGNHESRAISLTYGFYAECKKKYGNPNVWRYFMEVFDFLTISATIDNKIFAVHGGLSPEILSLEQIKVLYRFGEIPMEGAIADLMWSDPEPDKDGFYLSQRNAGYTFGADVVLWDDKLSTVWSAPNYCYRCGNVASVLEISESGDRHFNVFSAAPENTRATPEANVPDYFL
ncbi:serine/threonineprotein phosphatase PP2A, putative [Acanthamoeba castellanii str. Neff]|uniref:Serine/threonine-protein phosphatase n=1 Tax=Acanthamoeba castellanii (strain ATCC 30010 / Neff) TaxID=1257118 RepID=L8GWW0_ACACF|nr:serine/threonineprotein phosphatase PP2A, putative [Acanthamoeba castellanii str. Neff]ELR17485.1 serine/threonineprotein phosphatase PP2A, putative [Acanthamoeba castellanii str. Neff]